MVLEGGSGRLRDNVDRPLTMLSARSGSYPSREKGLSVESADLRIPYYWSSVDWQKLMADYPPPPFYAETVGRMSADGVRALQNVRFLERVAEAWSIPFYRDRWRAAGLEPGDIGSLDDIEKIPVFTTDDLKAAAAECPPYGSHHPLGRADFGRIPLKMQTSGGTTGMPRVTLFDPLAWEVQGILAARGLYAQGARPGDVIQIPFTQGLANAGWSAYTGIFHWLGAVPVTTGSGVVTPSERQLEYAKAWGTNGWFIASHYLDRLTEIAGNIGFDLRQLPTRYLHSFLGPDEGGALRRRIEEAWGAPVFDSYGSHEVGQIAFECSHRTHKHICEDVAYVEVLDVESGERLGYGETGNVVITSLHRSVPPFIRYNIRDLLALYPRERCECGMTTHKLSMLRGRSDEMIKLRGTSVYPLACQEAVVEDPRLTGEFVCVAAWIADGSARREEIFVRVERRSAELDAAAIASEMAVKLHRVLSIKVGVEVMEAGSLAEQTKGAHEVKPRRLLDLRTSSSPYIRPANAVATAGRYE